MAAEQNGESGAGFAPLVPILYKVRVSMEILSGVYFKHFFCFHSPRKQKLKLKVRLLAD